MLNILTRVIVIYGRQVPPPRPLVYSTLLLSYHLRHRHEADVVHFIWVPAGNVRAGLVCMFASPRASPFVLFSGMVVLSGISKTASRLVLKSFF